MGRNPLFSARQIATIAGAILLLAVAACGDGSSAPPASGGTAISIILPTARVISTTPANLEDGSSNELGYSLFLEAIDFDGEFVFVGDLLDGPDSHPDYYCQSISWDFGDGNGVTASPGCVEYEPGIPVPREFTETHTYEQPGTYEASLTYGDLVSNVVAVTVSEPGNSLPDEGDPLVGNAELVYPTIVELEPASAAPGEDVLVRGRGGYFFTAPSFYDESARGFTLFLDGLEIGALTCYGNACLGVLPLPDDIETGRHVVSVEGGSQAALVVE